MRALGVLLAAAVLLPAAPAAAAGCPAPDPDLPSWARARHMAVLNDSVLLSAEGALRRGFPCWRLRFIGAPALMLRAAEQRIRAGGVRVAPLVVVGIGYNSLWERGRRDHARWAARFDAEARRLLATLLRAGARQIIWVTLRRTTRATTDPSDWGELPLYSWYFPYVNERLRALDPPRRRLVLAEWARVGAHRGLTYDSIHLNERGGRRLQRLIETVLYEEAYAQADARAPANGG